MSVYVDPLAYHGWRYRNMTIMSCHLFADTVAELHAFAGRIGLKRAWFQGNKVPHYDLTASKRALALLDGASNVDRNQAVDIWNRIKKKK